MGNNHTDGTCPEGAGTPFAGHVGTSLYPGITNPSFDIT